MTTKNSPEEIFRLLQLGRTAQAYARCRKALKSDAGSSDLYHLLALIELERDQLDAAEKSARKSVQLNPSNGTAYNTLALIFRSRNRYGAALKAIEQAWKNRPGQLDIGLNRIDILFALNDLEGSKSACLELLASHPGVTGIVIRLSHIHEAEGDWLKAGELLKGWSPQHAGYEEVLLEYSRVLIHLGETATAVSVLEGAISTYRDARLMGDLAELYEISNRLPEAREKALSALELDPENMVARLVLAKVERRAGDFTAALGTLQAGSSQRSQPAHDAARYYELGRVHDALSNYEEAFASYEKANRIVHDIWGDREVHDDPRRFSEGINLLPDQERLQRFARSDISPVFMIGFPRSGTTLLHTILAQHSGILVLDEMPYLTDKVSELQAMHPDVGYPGILAELQKDETERLAADYLGEIQHADRLVIDKLPLNTLHIPLILSLFKHPRFIFSLRHPFDVCLSAFFQNFQLNASMAEFLDLKSTASFYSAVMDCWLACQRRYQFTSVTVRYEDLLEGPEPSLRGVLSLLEIEWDDSLLNDEKRVANSPVVSTSSYHQVSRPIYRHSLNRWQHYEAQLSGIRPDLEKYISTFGY